MIKKSVVLGISGFDHDSAAALMVDGRILAAAEEERFNRIKHYAGLPLMAADFCLTQAGVSVREVTDIAIGCAVSNKERIPALFDRYDGLANITWVPHHLSHAASTFFASDLEEAAFLNVDHTGDRDAIVGGEMSKDRCLPFFSVPNPHSLAMVQAAVTEYLGFRGLFDEYKVMGLASYGHPTYIHDMRRLLRLTQGGSLELDLDYFTYDHGISGTGRVTDEFIELFGAPRLPGSPLDKRHANIAASLQALLSEATIHLVKALRQMTGSDNLCYSGTLAHNCRTNTLIAEFGLFKNIFIHPACHDAGTAVGACFYADRIVRGASRQGCGLENIYLGPSFSGKEVRESVDLEAFDCQELDEEQLIRECAYDLAEGSVVAWCQGRMEWGSRALGNRSILADPRDREMIAKINSKVKYREPFRPFAPSVLIEYAREFFDYPSGIDASHMLFLARAKEAAVKLAPAVVHADGTSRIQAVSYEQNPRFWKLISKFQEITGIPLLLNTSFNIQGEPIVRTPREAIRCFSRTDIDVLYTGDFRISKIRPFSFAGARGAAVCLKS